MTTLYMTRHGITEWNMKEGRYCGCKVVSDIDLHPLGIMQAEALAERLKDEPLKAVYSSPMKRAVQTAEKLAKPHGLEIATVYGFRERSYGDWEGLTVRDIDEQFPGSYRQYEEDPGAYSPPGGESGFQVGDRVIESVEIIAENHPEDSVVLVTHEATNRILFCRLLGLNVSDYRRSLVKFNASLTIIEYSDGQARLILYNDSSHLKGL